MFARICIMAGSRDNIRVRTSLTNPHQNLAVSDKNYGLDAETVKGSIKDIIYKRLMNVKTITIDKVKGWELPKAWADEAEVLPEEEVQITIGPTRGEAAKELVRIMDRMGEEARRNGLTEKKLTKLLQDD